MTDISPLRIAYLINQYPKVSHTFIRREILALEKEGIEVLRLAVRGWDADLVDARDISERSRTQFLLKGGIWPLLAATIRLALTRPIKLGRSFCLALRMSRRSERSLWIHLVYVAEACLASTWLRKANIRHVHAHFGTNPAELAMLIRQLGGLSYSFTVHGPEEFDKPEALHLDEKICQAAFVVGVSSFGSSQLRRWTGASNWPKIRVVHCGIDESFEDPGDVPPPTGNSFVCVGRLCEQKGQMLLVQAAAELVRRGRDFKIVLAGDGEMRREIEASIERLALGDRVRITGWIGSDRVRQEILDSRAMVLPSFAEGLPVVIMEAMALERPVLSTYVAGIPELVLPGITGWLVPAGSCDQLADAMDAILSTPDAELANMGQNGRDRVIARHSARNEARKLAMYFRNTSLES